VTRGRVTVVGLGPGGVDLVTAGALAAVERVPHRFVRTTRHPAVAAVPGAASFDHLYERAARVADVYPAIVDALVAAAAEHGEVLYAVPGSPRVAERSVELLVADARVEVEVLPALSFLDLAWVRLGVDPLDAGVRLVDGHAFAVEAAGERGPLLVAQCDSRQVLSDVKLAVEGTPPATALVLQRLGLPGERVAEVAWADLDRVVEPDHLTSLYLPVLAEPVGRELARLVELCRVLRERCPWDAEQTHASLERHLLDETYEAVEAIEQHDPDDPVADAHLEEELGDVLYQVVFHARIAEADGRFSLADVARGIHDKLVRRHPHVFGADAEGAGGDAAADADADDRWEAIKREEKGRTSELDGLTLAAPSLLLASQVVKKAGRVGLTPAAPPPAASRLDAPPAGDDPLDDEALGAALLALVGRARAAGLDAELSLRRAALRLADRARRVEAGGPPPPAAGAGAGENAPGRGRGAGPAGG
jgi:tetrapyrrole methylase family protein/MazG family protein